LKKLIDLALARPRTITVIVLTIVVLGVLALVSVPVDILPIYKSPAVQVLTFYSGMTADSMASTITNPMERMTGTATGMKRQESRSILGTSIIRDYFRAGTDPNGALAQVNSLALAEIPNLPPGALPPIVLPYDPTATVPVCLVAVDSKTQGESVLYDVGRYEVRNMIMSSPGAVAPVVFGGKVRAILALLDPLKLQARGLSPTDVMRALANWNVYLPSGDARFGIRDYAIDSNSMYTLPEEMANIPLRVRPGSVDFLGDVATPEDTHFIQESMVRINGRREVYIPVYREPGASTLQVVDHLKEALPDMAPRLTRPGINLKMVMDQSIYVRQSLYSLATEAGLGAVLCSLVIFVFLGEWRMTAIAVLLIPITILAAIFGLYALGATINVMTLAGLALAIGPLVDIAIVVLENTHRHLHGGTSPREAARAGAAEVILPELVATGSTLLVLAPLALMSGSGQFLFQPLALTVALAMIAAFLLAMSFVPSRAAAWLRRSPTRGDGPPPAGLVERFMRAVQYRIDQGIHWYVGQLDRVLRHPLATVVTAAGVLALVLVLLGPRLRRDFFPEVDAGAFEMYVRTDTGTRLGETEKVVAQVEKLVDDTLGSDKELVLSELGVWADWSAAYTPNTGPMDAVLKIQLVKDRHRSAQEYAQLLRAKMAADPRFAAVEVAFNTAGTVGSALNEGRATPINVRIKSKDPHKAHRLAEHIRQELAQIDGVVDARILQRLDYPEYYIDVDRGKARDLGLTQQQIMRNVIASINSSVQFNKRIFWIDRVSGNQYYVGVQYPKATIQSLQTVLNISITSDVQKKAVPLANMAHIRARNIPALVTHSNLQSTIDLTMNVHGRDLGHVADDIARALDRFGASRGKSSWAPYDPDTAGQQPLPGAELTLTGQFGRMEEMFANFGLGLLLAVVFVYFLMVILLDSYVVPLVILSAVPVGLAGVVPLLFLTGTALNVQSLLGVIFMVGIVVANTVLMADFAQRLRAEEGLSPRDAIHRAAEIRARPVVMTALAALFALVPMALALERGSEANAPLGRAVIGGLLAGLVTTLVVVPALYSLLVRDKRPPLLQLPPPPVTLPGP
jgi:multidrug efflux pump subunit AcrB